jgi:hypothetical protein
VLCPTCSPHDIRAFNWREFEWNSQKDGLIYHISRCEHGKLKREPVNEDLFPIPELSDDESYIE